MFGINGILFGRDLERTRREIEYIERMLKDAKEWSPTMPWEPELALRADTYKVHDLFPELKARQISLSPNGAFVFVKKRLPRAAPLWTAQDCSAGDAPTDQRPRRLRRVRAWRMNTTDEVARAPSTTQHGMETMMQDKRFILWSRLTSHEPPRDQEGNITTSGCLGELTEDNVYLKAYANYRQCTKRLDELEVGECVQNVIFSLSGEHALYDIYRVR